jgi:hypothetical protein
VFVKRRGRRAGKGGVVLGVMLHFILSFMAR